MPSFPTRQSWPVWFENRPCVLRVDASDVTLDLGGFVLALANDQPQGAVLIGVAAGARNVVVRNGTLGRCAIGLFFATGCQTVAAAALTVQDFAESGILAYAPRGFRLQEATVGPNLTALAVSQETYALQAYGAAVPAAALAAWKANPDNLAVQEASHVTGVAVVPGAASDSPNYPMEDTSSGVVLENLTVLQLQMYYREHSIRFGIAASGASQIAVGSFDEALAEAYDVRLAAAKSLGVGFVPDLACAAPPKIVYAGGFLLNTQDYEASAPAATTWVRGVDRDGQALRGAQAVLLVGCGATTLTNVQAAKATVTALPPRVRGRPDGCRAANLLVSTRGMAIVDLPAPPAAPCCARNARPAGYFSRLGAVTFFVQPTATYSATTNGSYVIL